MTRITRIVCSLACISILPLSALAQTGIITTYAGHASPKNGTQAITQFLESPYFVVADGTGGCFVSSPAAAQVYRVTAEGSIFIVAGDGSYGSSGDGGAATAAQLIPRGIAVDASGNLYIADDNSSIADSKSRIRKVSQSGVISTVAGNGSVGFSGDGGVATSAQLSHPEGIAVDASGNLFIADTGNNRIRKVSTSGIISTVAGNGSQGFSGDGKAATLGQLSVPTAVAVDATGNFFIADTMNQRIRRVSPNGVISTVAGNGSAGFGGDRGPAISAQLNFPSGISANNGGDLFIADTSNSRIRKVDSIGTISTVAGNGSMGFSGDGGPATSSQFSTTGGIAVDATGNLFIADTGNNRIRLVTASGAIRTVAGNGPSGSVLEPEDGGPATSSTLFLADGVAVDATGNIFINDGIAIRRVNPGGMISTVFTTRYLDSDSLSGIATDANGNIFISDVGYYQFNYEDSSINEVTPSGVISRAAGGTSGFGGDGGPATSAQFSFPGGLAVDVTGSLFIADTGNNRIRKVAPNGVISTIAGNGTSGFGGDGGPAVSAQIKPSGIAVDASGNLFIAEADNNRIRKVTQGGVISTVAGEGSQGFSGDGGPAIFAQLDRPAGVAVDAAGNLFIADTFNNRIRKVIPGGVISTVAGSGLIGFSGDGGAATSARLFLPRGVALSGAGDLFIADTRNQRIRKVSLGPLPLSEPVGSRGDFNGDGRADVLWRDTAGNISTWIMDGLTVSTNTFISNIWTGWFIVGVGDFNNDGKSDILWRDTDGDVAIWLMDGAVVTKHNSVGNIWTGWSVAGVGDFDGDGKADVLWHDVAGNVAIWLMDGTTVSSYRTIGNVWTGWSIAGVGDFDGDGKADILWRDEGGNVAIWLMNGFNLTSGTTIGNMPITSAIAGVGDFNGDGRADILWRDISGNVSMWFINGNTIARSEIIANIWTGWSIVGVGDFNGDGKADILWRDNTGEVAIWLMDGTTVSSYRSIGKLE